MTMLKMLGEQSLSALEVVEHCVSRHDVPMGLIDPTILGFGKAIPKMENSTTKYDASKENIRKPEFHSFMFTGYVPKSMKQKLVERLGRLGYYESSCMSESILVITGNMPSKSLLSNHKGSVVSAVSLAGITHIDDFSNRINKIKRLKL